LRTFLVEAFCIGSLHFTVVTGFPWSWKIIENPGKINFPGKSWKIDKNSQVMEKLKNH